MSSYSVSDARKDLARVVDESSSSPVEITRHGETVAVMVSADIYQQLHDAWEDMEDLKAFDEALADPSPHIPWDEVREELGL